MDGPLTPRRAPLRAPFTVCLWLTDSCNLACKYCYAMPFSGRRMDTDRVLGLIDELAYVGVFDLTLAGGEPMIHPAFLDIVERAVGRGLRVGVLSNGLKLDRRMREELEARTDKRNFIVQISIDSADPAIGDVARGRTAEVVENIRALEGTSLDLQIACVISRANVDTAHTIIDAFYPLVKRFHFLNIQRTARALEHPELLLDESDCLKFWLRLNEHRKNFPEDLFLPSLRVQLRSGGLTEVAPEFAVGEQASFECASCTAGWTHINVDAKFNVLGCDIAKDYTHMGNVADRSFEAVWHSEQAEKVRNAPFPACYLIKGPDGKRLADELKPELTGAR